MRETMQHTVEIQSKKGNKVISFMLMSLMAKPPYRTVFSVKAMLLLNLNFKYEILNTIENLTKQTLYEVYGPTGSRALSKASSESDYYSSANKLRRALILTAALIFIGLLIYGFFALVANFTSKLILNEQLGS